jgi:sugar phosphate isomerase/epimerase
MARFPELGIQSYCFREFKSVPSLVEVLKKVSLPVVEIYPGHIDYTWDERRVEAALAPLRAAGIGISAYGGVTLKNDEADVRKLCEFARRAATPYLTVVTVEEAGLPMMERLAAEYRVKFCIHNHGRGFQFGNFPQIRRFFDRVSDAFKLCLDAAWFLDAGEDPVAAIGEFSGRLCGVHLKDFSFDSEGKPRDVIIGTGGLDLPTFMKRLREISFQGYLSLEYEGNPSNPVPEVLECLQAVKRNA